MDLSTIQESLVEDIEQEAFVLKSTLETTYLTDGKYIPFLVFYKNPKEKTFAIAPQESDSFIYRMKNIAEVLHLYSALDASAVTITFTSKISIHDNEYELFNLFVLNQDHAWLVHYPFTVEDGIVKWYPELDSCTPVDSYDFDEVGKDMVSMFYNFIHIQESAFTVAEILSYLSTTDAAIHQFDQKYEYFNFQVEK